MTKNTHKKRFSTHFTKSVVAGGTHDLFFAFSPIFFGSRQKLRQMATEVVFLKLFEVCSCTNWDVLFGCLRSGSNSHLLCALQFTGRKFVVSYAPQNFSFQGGIKRSGPGGGGVDHNSPDEF